jgi:hypothetical protein
MRKFKLSLLFSLIPLIVAPAAAHAQSLAGNWRGDVLPGLPIVLHIHGKPGAYKATADSPNQGAGGMAAKVVQHGVNVTIKIAASGQFAFSGKLKGNTISGTWSQNGQTGSMKLSRMAQAAAHASKTKAHGSGLAGDWSGTVLPGLPIVVHVSGSPGQYTATADSPNQGATGIDTTIVVNGNSVTITLNTPAPFTFNGTVNGNKISGTWSQNGQTGQMTFTR